MKILDSPAPPPLPPFPRFVGGRDRLQGFQSSVLLRISRSSRYSIYTPQCVWSMRSVDAIPIESAYRLYSWLQISMYSSNVGIDDEYWIVIVRRCICTVVIQFAIYVYTYMSDVRNDFRVFAAIQPIAAFILFLCYLLLLIILEYSSLFIVDK